MGLGVRELFDNNIKVHFAGSDGGEIFYAALLAAQTKYRLFSCYKYILKCRPDDDFRLPADHVIRVQDTEKVTAFIEVRVTPQRGQGFEKLAERITNYPEVKSIYLMSGAFDFAIFLEGKTLKEVSMFVSTKLSTLEAVAGTATHFVLKKYKDHGMILIDKEPANRMKVTP